MSAASEAIKAIGRRVLVCGGRDFDDVELLYRILDAAHAASPIECIISGMARGADTLAAEWARQRRVPLIPFPADWNRYPRAAGPIRNRRMLAEGHPTLVIAFPGGTGTADMVRQTQDWRVPLIKVGWK